MDDVGWGSAWVCGRFVSEVRGGKGDGEGEWRKRRGSEVKHSLLYV